MVELAPKSLAEQLATAMPVIREQIQRISRQDASNFYPESKPEYEEGSLPFISPQLQYEILVSIQNIDNIGQGEDRYLLVDRDGYYTPTQMVSYLKQIRLNVKVHSFNLEDQDAAWITINNIHDRLRWESVQEEFEKVNIGILSISDARNISFNFQGRVINAMDLDLIVSTTTNDVDYDTSGWIETADISGELIPCGAELIQDMNIFELLDGYKNFTSETEAPESIEFTPTGTKALVLGTDPDIIYEYHMDDPYDIENMVYTGKSLTLPNGYAETVRFDSSGKFMFVICSYPVNILYQFKCIAPFDIATASADGYYDLNQDIIDYTGESGTLVNSRTVDISPDDKVLSVLNITGGILQYKWNDSVEDIMFANYYDLKDIVFDMHTDNADIRWISDNQFIMVNYFGGESRFVLINNTTDDYIVTEPNTDNELFTLDGVKCRCFVYKNKKLYPLDKNSDNLYIAEYQNTFKETISV